MKQIIQNDREAIHSGRKLKINLTCEGTKHICVQASTLHVIKNICNVVKHLASPLWFIFLNRSPVDASYSWCTSHFLKVLLPYCIHPEGQPLAGV